MITINKHKFKKYKGNEIKNVMENLKNKQEKQFNTTFNFVSDQRSSFAA